MSRPKKYAPYNSQTTCSVPDCGRRPEFEVYLWDYYPHANEEFFEQDFTCPFLCREHMEENERRADGDRVPRGVVSYPFTNKHLAQGYNKYAPIEKEYPKLYGIPEVALPRDLIGNIVEVNNELLAYLAEHPELLREMNPRNFEKVVAAILQKQGFEVDLTQQSRDGGFDVLAAKKGQLGNHLYVVECKRYSGTQKVGVEVVRQLYGVKTAKRATMGVIATTSYFTKSAVEFANPLQYEISLRDFEALKEWLREMPQTSA